MQLPTFDELKDLAQRDPEGFEKLRAELIEECILSSSKSNQPRLRGLQFVIESRRRVAGSPMKALLDIQSMMHDSLFELQQALLGPRGGCEPAPASTRILEFRPPLSSAD
ncbi:DUF3135 domain-containing protein [Marinobacter salinisoli]|uniref:DUF3135 domain-containing protein n=1 Tax=Marinobacter salinisoli TaxID=2769486 RepID=A0ABX7MRB2_9GAMM|nr:DUF3135 domain-containing protein [Marinobacter salinisoli]QSP94684.1 DUF3135 domain-containing protein [Marinobacter salinisoli]